MAGKSKNSQQQTHLKVALLAVLALPLALKPFTSQDQKAAELASEVGRPGGVQPAVREQAPAPSEPPARTQPAAPPAAEAPIAENKRICGMVYRLLYTSRTDGSERKSLVYLQRSSPECSARLEYDADCTLKSVQRTGSIEVTRSSGEAARELEGLIRADLARAGVDCASRDRETANTNPAPPPAQPQRPIIPARDAEAERREREALAKDVRDCVRDSRGERLSGEAKTSCLIDRLSRIADEDRDICATAADRSPRRTTETGSARERDRECRPESESARRARIERETDRIYNLVISDLRSDLTSRDLGRNESGRDRAESLLDALKNLRGSVNTTRLDRMEQRVSGLIVGATVRERSTDSIEELRDQRREIAELTAQARQGDVGAVMRLQQAQQRALESMLNARNAVAEPVWSLQRSYLAALQPEDRRIFLQPYTSLLGEMNGIRESMQPWAQMQSVSLLASLPQMQGAGAGPGLGGFDLERPGDLGPGRSRYISDFRNSLGGPGLQSPGSWGNSWVNSTANRTWAPQNLWNTGANTWSNPRAGAWGQQQPGWSNPNAWGRTSTWGQQQPGWGQQQPGWSPRGSTWGQPTQGWGQQQWGGRL